MQRVVVTFTQEDLNSLSILLDAGVKALGLQSVKQTAAILDKLEAAVADANSVKLPEHE